MSFTRSVKRIPARRWDDLKATWRRTAPTYEDVGAAPPVDVLDILEQNQSLLPLTGTEKEGRFDVPELRHLILREGIFVLHKSAALLRSASRDINAKQYTHAEITTYTGAVFAAKAVCIFLGVWFSPKKVSNDNWFLDCFSAPHRGRYHTSAIRAQCNRIGHREVWLILQRIFRKSEHLPLDSQLVHLIIDSSADQFAKHRNRIQYFNLRWYYDDLHGDDATYSDWISPFTKDLYLGIDPDDENTHFGVLFFLMMLRAAHQLFHEIASGTPGLQQELDLFYQNVSISTSTLYTDSWLHSA